MKDPSGMIAECTCVGRVILITLTGELHFLVRELNLEYDPFIMLPATQLRIVWMNG